MKIIYHINSLYNPGGMERVTLNKVLWWVEKGVEVVVVTTDQCGRPTFYPFPAEVRMVDLGINYTEDREAGILRHILSYLHKRRLHRKRLAEVLFEEKADIVVSLYPGESSFIPSIGDGSKKVLELHQSKFFHRQYANSGLKGLIDRLREVADLFMVRKFDKFVVLTEEDKGYWGNLKNIEVIPNAAIKYDGEFSSCLNKRVIAAGRLDYQKGFDRLIDAWCIAQHESEIARGWKLDIFGQGEWYEFLCKKIDDSRLSNSVYINKPTNNIRQEYVNSSFLVLSSHYEGFGMVLVEAMSCGTPVISFDCPCGPKDIIIDNKNGILVKEGDIHELARAIIRLMEDNELRISMGLEARKVAEKYSQEKVMKKWEDCFRSILS